jgi:ribosomal subunit interface protein
MSKAIVDKNGRVTPAKSAQALGKAQIPPVVVTVTFRHVAPTDAIRAYAERKFSHVAKFLKRTCEVHLILTVDKYRQHGEVIVKSGRLLVTALEETHDLYSVIDLLADKVGRQLKSHLGKFQDKKLRAPSTGKILTAAEDSAPANRIDRA